MLLQRHQFRENQSLLHGLPPPQPPVMLGDVPELELPEDGTLAKSAERVATAIETAVDTPGDNPIANAVDRATAVLTKAPAKKTPLWQKVALGAALLGGGAAAPFAADAIMGGGDDVPPVVQPADADLLTELQERGYDVAPTDLGEDIKRAFRLNPELRDQLIDDVKRTLELQGVRATTDGT